jgi:hypothetical protein
MASSKSPLTLLAPGLSRKKRTARWRRTRTFSFVVLTLFAMFFFPESQQIWPVRQKTSDTIDVLYGQWLQDDAAELILKNPNIGKGRQDPVE